MRIFSTDKGTKVHLMGVVKGLVSESGKVKETLEEVPFQIGTLPISKEDLVGLGSLERLPEISMSTPEIAYARNLQRYGEVRIPPPSYIVLLEHCRTNSIRIEGIDMDDEHFTSAFCKHISGSELIRQSMWEKRLLKKVVESDSPEEFATRWDKLINKYKGYQRLEAHREMVMAKNMRKLSRNSDLFSIVEVERIQGIMSIMKGWGWKEVSR